MTSISDFDDDLLERLFRHLTDARDRERAGCVNRQWCRASRQEHDDAWASICRRELHLDHARGDQTRLNACGATWHKTSTDTPGLLRERLLLICVLQVWQL